MAKTKTSKPAVPNKASLTGAPPVRPVKETLTKTALINLVAEQNDLPRKTAASVYATLEGVFLGSV
ncbi:MAG: DNA-binding protein, partial [Methylocella sp.]